MTEPTESSEAAADASEVEASEAAATAGEPAPTHPEGYGFVIAGVQKAGTTSLYEVMRRHKQIAHPGAKELSFFVNERIDWRNPPYEQYNKKIHWRKSSLIAGEATPRYIFWPGAMERIYAYNPEMLVILSFRDPIERAFSNWAMATTLKRGPGNFDETIRLGSVASSWPRTMTEYRNDKPMSIMGRGFYGAQLAHAIEIFGRDQLLLLDYHRLFRELDVSLARIAHFLDLRPFTRMPSNTHRNVGAPQLVGRAPTAADVTALAGLYQADLGRFAELSGLDIADWPTTRVLNGTLDPAVVAAALTARVTLIDPDAPPPPTPAPVDPDGLSTDLSSLAAPTEAAMDAGGGDPHLDPDEMRDQVAVDGSDSSDSDESAPDVPVGSRA